VPSAQTAPGLEGALESTRHIRCRISLGHATIAAERTSLVHEAGLRGAPKMNDIDMNRRNRLARPFGGSTGTLRATSLARDHG